jgi:hypothetical protein
MILQMLKPIGRMVLPDPKDFFSSAHERACVRRIASPAAFGRETKRISSDSCKFSCHRHGWIELSSFVVDLSARPTFVQLPTPKMCSLHCRCPQLIANQRAAASRGSGNKNRSSFRRFVSRRMSTDDRCLQYKLITRPHSGHFGVTAAEDGASRSDAWGQQRQAKFSSSMRRIHFWSSESCYSNG